MTAEMGTQPVTRARRNGGHWLLEGLTSEQQAVVQHERGPLIVVAGAGSGKTRALTYRIAWLVESGMAEPRELLAVTFSVRAADELQGRLRDMLGVERASGVRAGTFHSVCARLLRDHSRAFGPDFTIYDQTEVRRTIDWLISEKQRGEVDEELSRTGIAVAEIAREISTAKNRLVTVDEYERAASHQAAGLIAGVWRHLEEEMRRRSAVDFDDLLVHGVRLLAEHPQLLARLRARWKWLLVDELQDTNPAQLELATLLAGSDGNVVFVGDMDQTIYSFRCADPAGMRKLADRFPAHRTVSLRRNFRSRAEILTAAWRCVSQNSGREASALIAHRGPGGTAAAYGFAGERDEAAWIARDTRRALDAGCPGEEILILCRKMRATRPVQDALRCAGIAHRVIGQLGLYERAEVKDAIAYLALLANPRDVAAFGRAIQSPRRQIGERTISRIVALARERHHGDLVMACASERAQQALAKEGAREKLANFADGLNAARGELAVGARSLAHIATTVLMMRGGIVPFQQWVRDHSDRSDRRHDAEKVLDDLRSLIRHVQSYEQQAASPTLTGFLEVAAGLSSQQVEPGEEDDRVIVSTVHGFKGGEARLVMLIGCEEGLLPSWQAVESGDNVQLEEERRVWYVAATRAQDAFACTYAARRCGRPTNGPSRFLTEAGLIEPPAPAA